MSITFTLDSKEATELLPHPQEEIPESEWVDLNAALAVEESVVAYAPDFLKKRWCNNELAIVLYQKRIIACVSTFAVISDDERERVYQVTGKQLPSINILRAGTGWTNPDWRGRGISLRLQRHLYAPHQARGDLLISATIGAGSSPIVAKLGWQIVGWNELPFISSLINWFDGDEFYSVPRKKWLTLQHRQPYNGHPLCKENINGHVWDNYVHLLIADLSLATCVENELCTAMKNDLLAWREVVTSLIIP